MSQLRGMNQLRAVYRESDVPAVVAEILAVPYRTAVMLLDRHGRPRSFGFRGARCVTGDEVRAFLAKAAGDGT